MKKTVQRFSSGLLAVCLLAAAVPAALAAEETQEHWAQPVIQDFADRGYLASADLEADAAMTCGQFVALIDAITGSAELDVVLADADEVLTRERAMTLVADLLGLTGSEGQEEALAQFGDRSAISADAVSGVAAMAAAGYINGTSDGLLLPQKQLTWAEGLTILRNVLDALPFDLNDYDVVYGTATLSFAQYYAGDVTSTDGYGVDGVSSATVSMYNTFSGMYTNYTEDKTEGYNILGVQGVNVAVAAEDYEAYTAINPTFTFTRTVPDQYKTVTIVDGEAVYSATHFNVAETVTDAVATLKTGSVWGDYEIDVTETSTANIRNNRSDEGWAVNSDIQGTILETASGLKVGMEFLQSMWLQPWEVSFNVSADSAQNAHITGWDNLSELSKLVGETVVSITYMMPDSTYIYTFDGIYIKPVYAGAAVSAAFAGTDSAQVTITGVPEELEDVTVTITYGSGRNSTTVASAAEIQNGTVTMDSVYDSAQTYTVKISSSNYADIVADLPVSAAQLEQLTALVGQAQALIEAGTAASDNGLTEHYAEGAAMLANVDAATSAEAADLISELTDHLSVYAAGEN